LWLNFLERVRPNAPVAGNQVSGIGVRFRVSGVSIVRVEPEHLNIFPEKYLVCNFIKSEVMFSAKVKWLVGVASSHDHECWPDRLYRGWKPLPHEKVSCSIRLAASGGRRLC
jgi:hypothetical protein